MALLEQDPIRRFLKIYEAHMGRYYIAHMVLFTFLPRSQR